jgi:hypothetical protein
MSSYEDRYINHADIPETRARARRFKAFMAASGFTENVDVESVKHQQLRTLVKTQTDGHMDHTTFLELGHMAVLLTEPYFGKIEEFACEELYVVEVPESIAPYCGMWFDELGVEPGTKSFLITTRLKKRQLDEVLEKLKEAAAKMPPWNYLEEDDQ